MTLDKMNKTGIIIARPAGVLYNHQVSLLAVSSYGTFFINVCIGLHVS